MRIIIKSSLVIIMIMLFIGCGDASKELANKELISKCKDLKIGMNYNVVLEKMGQPLKADDIEREGRKKKRIYFPSPKLSSTFIQCVIDNDSNLVEEIICDEDYRVTNK